MKRGSAGSVVDDWFRNAFDSKMTEILLEGGSMICQYLRTNAVRKLFEQHPAGQRDNHKILFSLRTP